MAAKSAKLDSTLAQRGAEKPCASILEQIGSLCGGAEWENALAPLPRIALRVRERILRLAVGGGCFVGSALSCTDLLVYLYARFLNITPDNLDEPTRDYFFLSKGHAAPALYATLVEAGLLPSERLENHLQPHDSVYWHPNRCLTGVEFHAGSLGHLLPVAVGVALECKMRRGSNRVVVLTGDGELNEGTNWEA